MRFLLVAAVTLGGAFGAASAGVESIDDDVMLLDLEVEVLGSAQSVVAHLAFDDDPLLTIPLLNRGEGVFGARLELEVKNYAVVFETVGPEGETSEPVLLSQLGAELGSSDPAETTTTTTSDGISAENRRTLWLAVAAGAASLSLIAFWVLGPKDEQKQTPEDIAGGDEEE